MNRNYYTSLLLSFSFSIFSISFSQDRITGELFSTRSEVIAQNGMVATSHPLATQIGLDILKKGGNAIDAAIAANAALGLMEPTGNGIGGDLYAIVWSAKENKLYGLNASGRSPKSLTLKYFKENNYKTIPAYGPLPVSVPGCVDGWFSLHEKFGNIKMSEILKPTIEYADKVGYSLKNIFVIDGSKRSTKANAFFSGLGPKKTIALYDTLIEKHSDEELVAVLAHEVGHFKKKHILLTLIISIIQLGLMSYLFEVCMSYNNIAEALGSSQMNFHIGLIAFSFVFSPIGLIIGIFLNILSRKNEFEADDYAKKTYDGNALKLALKKLSVDTLSNLYPHPLYVFVHYSHPPLIQRLSNLKS